MRYESQETVSLLRSEMAGWLKLVTPYSEDFIGDFKESIPASHRRWVPEERIWLVAETCKDDLLKTLRRWFSTIAIRVGEPVSADPFLQVFSLVPSEYRAGLYRALAQGLHPDHGGSAELMKRLNAAYEVSK